MKTAADSVHKHGCKSYMSSLSCVSCNQLCAVMKLKALSCNHCLCYECLATIIKVDDHLSIISVQCPFCSTLTHKTFSRQLIHLQHHECLHHLMINNQIIDPSIHEHQSSSTSIDHHPRSINPSWSSTKSIDHYWLSLLLVLSIIPCHTW